MPETSRTARSWRTQPAAVRDYLVSRGIWGISIVATTSLALVLALTLIVVSPWVRHQLALSFTHQSQAYTELYFAGSPPVSSTAGADQSELTVAFVIASHENGPAEYSYLVRALDPTGQPVAQHTSSISVADGEARTNQVRLTLPAGSTWSAVTVNLLNRPEALHYTAPDARTPGA